MPQSAQNLSAQTPAPAAPLQPVALQNPDAQQTIAASRQAQHAWTDKPLSERLRFVRRLRNRIAANAEKLLDCFPVCLSRTRADSLTAEVIPLAEACRFVELRAKHILATEKLSSKGRPHWLSAVHVEVRHEPWGVVLIIGPANYPLFLVGVQALQALVAGNAVLIKPGHAGGPVARAFASLAYEAGLPANLLVVLDETVEAASNALASGVNKVVLTGSVQTGRAVLREAAGQVIPVTAELSGADPVFIQRGADVKRAAAAVAFGTRLNGGETCIAPRRVYIHKSLAESFRAALADPHLSITAVDDDEEALSLASRSHFALGATVFGEESAARSLAARINAGVVVVNDMIVPTADPRVPFGGRSCSGFGTTRGAIGLLEMTTPKAVVVQRGKRLRHLEPMPPNAEEFFLAYLAATHTSPWSKRLAGWRRLAKAISGTRKVKS